MVQLTFEGMENYGRKLTEQECFDRLLEIFIDKRDSFVYVEDGLPPLEPNEEFYYWIKEEALPNYMKSVDWQAY